MNEQTRSKRLGVGQVALELDTSLAAVADQLRDLARISDPALSELDFEALLDELLVRVEDLLEVDTVAILLLDAEHGELVATAAKGIEEEVEAGVRVPLGHGFAGRVAKERVAIFIADVDHADIHNPLLREKGIQSLLGVPLIVEGDLIGVLHVGSLTPRQFDHRDLAVLELAAARVAPAIERARLLGALAREHQNAVMLQRSLLPRRLAATPGVTVGARYMPARDEVGGDWYDVIELPEGKIGAVIGDVVGHGLAAAALMGQLRTAVHAYALDGHEPGRALELVNRFAVSLDLEVMATAAYAVVDPEAGTFCYASAGHLPPVILGPDGARLVEVTIAPPLGAFGYASCPQHELQLDSGEILLLYTDGLIERRGIPLTDSLDELVRAVRGATSPEEACLLVMDRLVPHRGPRDDVAVVAVQNDVVPETLVMELPAAAPMLARVRRALRRWLAAQEIEREVAAEIMIAVGEACANAVEHAYGPAQARFALRVERDEDVVRVSVRDRGRWRSPRGEYRGRGLKIMEAAMDSLEVNARDDGTEITMQRSLRSR